MCPLLLCAYVVCHTRRRCVKSHTCSRDNNLRCNSAHRRGITATLFDSVSEGEDGLMTDLLYGNIAGSLYARI